MTVPAAPAAHQFSIGRGDVIVVQGTSLPAKVIEAGEVAAGLPPYSHVACFDHFDANGTPWGLEGRPGGVGWADVSRYLADPRTLANCAQPKTPAQRAELCQLNEAMRGTPYAWVTGILADAYRDLGGDALWKPDPVTKVVPCHVVCSSYLAYTYARIGLASPRPQDWATTEPGDWALFIEQEGWKHAAAPGSPAG